MPVTSQIPQQIPKVLVPNLDSPVSRTSGKQISGVKRDRQNPVIMASECSQQVSRVLVPKFDGPVSSTTGKQSIRVESHFVNFTIMASETSQLTIFLVPQFDSVVTGATCEQVGGVECDCANAGRIVSRTVECFQQSIIFVNENNFISTF